MPVAAGTYNYILAPWEWRAEVTERPDGSTRTAWAWYPSPGIGARVDLRPPSIKPDNNGTVTDGFMFAAIDPKAEMPKGAILLGNDLNGALSNQRDMEEALELPAGELDAPTVLDALWLVLNGDADPTGVDHVKPIMPTHDGEMLLELMGHSVVKRERYDPVKHPKVLSLVRADYNRIVQDAERAVELEASSPDEAARLTALARAKNAIYLNLVARKLGVKPSDIAVPSGGATITDDFNRADTTNTLGANWTALNNTWRINGNAAGNNTNGAARARYDGADLDSDDHYAQTTLTLAGNFHEWGMLARYSDAATTGYEYVRQNQNSNSHQIFEVSAGTATSIAAASDDYLGASGYTPLDVYIEADGSSLDAKEGGVSKVTVTDTTHTGFTRAGMYGFDFYGNVKRDDFIAEDLGGTPPPVAPVRHRLGLLGVGR